MGDLALLKAVEAGVDIIDTCLAPYAYRSSHPAVEPLVASLLGTNRDTGLDLAQLAEIGREMEKHIPKYVHLADATRFAIIDIDVLLHQTPGGMLSNLVNQLREMNELDKLEKVFEALPEVRRELGQLPLVTPTSQIVGIQTVNNVLFDKPGQRYTPHHRAGQGPVLRPVRGHPAAHRPPGAGPGPGRLPAGQKPITVRPGEILEPELETARKHAGELARDLDELLIYALFPVTGKSFLMWKHGLEKPPAEVTPRTLEDVQRERELVSRTLQQARAAGPQAALQAGPASAGAPPKTEAAAPRAGLQSFDVYVNGEYFRVEVGAEGRPVIAAGPGRRGRIRGGPRAAAGRRAAARRQRPKPAPTPGPRRRAPWSRPRCRAWWWATRSAPARRCAPGKRWSCWRP